MAEFHIIRNYSQTDVYSPRYGLLPEVDVVIHVSKSYFTGKMQFPMDWDFAERISMVTVSFLKIRSWCVFGALRPGLSQICEKYSPQGENPERLPRHGGREGKEVRSLKSAHLYLINSMAAALVKDIESICIVCSSKAKTKPPPFMAHTLLVK